MSATMSSTRPKEAVPAGFKSWKEFNEGKKKIRKLKHEYQVKKLEKQKENELKKQTEAETEKKNCEEPSTLSIAVPGSILDNAQSVELRTYLAGQIARAAAVFKVDEIIVYDDVGIHDSVTTKTVASLSDSGEVRPARKCCATLARILQYLECPQYLRKDFFPKHKDLEYAGLLNPLDAPHHMRMQDDGKFREGIVLAQPAKNGSYVNVGLLKQVKVNLALQPGIRVTVELLKTPPEAKRLCGRVVPPTRPQKETGIYWGYSVRLASSLNTVFTECPYKEGYDVSIGTSERGKPVESVPLTSHHHALVVFGGLAGIEAALEADDVLTVDDPSLLFDHYLNTCPDQGSRTIRTEEALLITLAELRTRLKPKVPTKVLSNSAESDLGDYADLEEEIDASLNDSVLDDSKKADEDNLNNTSMSCIENTDLVEEGNRNSPQNGQEELECNESENIEADVTEERNQNHNNEIITEKKKKKKRVFVVEETDESTNAVSESILENIPTKKQKKDKRRSKHEAESMDASGIEESMNTAEETIDNAPNVKRKKDKRKSWPAESLSNKVMEAANSMNVERNGNEPDISKSKKKKRKSLLS